MDLILRAVPVHNKTREHPKRGLDNLRAVLETMK
jgi:hypothetical protein